MKRIIVTSLMLSLLSSPGAFVTGASAQVFCDDNVPEEWKRPGGYCDQLPGNDGWSIIEKSGGAAIVVVPPPKPDPIDEHPCIDLRGGNLELDRMLEELELGERIHVAEHPCVFGNVGFEF